MLPNTLFIGQQLFFLPVCESTSSEAHQLLNKNEAIEGCTVITAQQTRGRGQRGNNWEAEPGKNITLSVILSPSFLAVRQQFYLNMAVSLGVLDLLRSQGLAQAQVKWPNDLYFEDKKLGGILIENTINSLSLQHSIVGIGLNVNQLAFGYPTATSMASVAGHPFGLEKLTEQLLELVEKRYLQLRNGRHDSLKYDYLQALYRYQEVHSYVVDGQETEGQIVGVCEDGRLAVETKGQLRYFAFKEIGYLI
ncbi:BirA family biotin operon repressor/biotin-[acetyl-CoA-carboxylase] ligase [Pontibacter ummariensis]|uniref:BirA family transcriptional regulator, biotin operon repressor / biotin-[acetyl-CoA-carboxylase] ligase n=1 Tax=Pontibacter ummariensis TaxID=1610492 RepID=A0A239B6V3_9BACT|nr:biotin--[acetyl-CoA-carboxylase] ligase [Pontibacter ummariensis]PRY16333.1 BirA family biotin operon repressor/biotin-[acetyl-CoA-carboxylase] ligase [Pontibacter ummariensis]SNS03321.1 BirA family transcriptional regulator, biotin operon repressor / biotin-[acetyl-CoA-carboxylase] ligase [Pontibacter ummariensis]